MEDVMYNVLVLSIIAGLIATPQENPGGGALFAEAIQQQPQEKQTRKLPPADFVAYEKEPVVVKKVEPVYPEIALRAALDGEVLLKVWVDESGDVVEAQIIRSDQKIFEQAAADAAKQWKFTPALANGKPVAVWVTIPFRFRLSKLDKGKSGELSGFIESLKSMATNIIQGRDLNQAKSSVTPEAYVIDGNHYENLYAVLNGEIKSCKVTQGPTAKIEFFQTHLAEDMNSASMVLKAVSADGKRTRYNSVSFARQPGGAWKIMSWHVSG
jgi:protein TonB